MTNLQTPFPLEPTCDYARSELCNMLEMTEGDKILIIDPLLSGILGLIADSAVLGEHGVVKSVHLKAGPIAAQSAIPRGIVYLVRNTVKNAKLIAEQMRTQVCISLATHPHTPTMHPSSATPPVVCGATVHTCRRYSRARLHMRQAERNSNNTFFICMVPRQSVLMHRVLEEEGVWTDTVSTAASTAAPHAATQAYPLYVPHC